MQIDCVLKEPIMQIADLKNRFVTTAGAHPVITQAELLNLQLMADIGYVMYVKGLTQTSRPVVEQLPLVQISEALISSDRSREGCMRFRHGLISLASVCSIATRTRGRLVFTGQT